MYSHIFILYVDSSDLSILVFVGFDKGSCRSVAVDGVSVPVANNHTSKVFMPRHSILY